MDKKHFFLVPIIILIYCCNQSIETVDLENYICPNLGSDYITIYEYQNTDERVYPMKYMLLERDSNNWNSYYYKFMNSNFEVLSGYKEIRENYFTKFDKMLFVEQGISSNDLLSYEIVFENWNMPYQFSKEKNYEYNVKWKSENYDGIVYNQSTKKKLIEEPELIKRLNFNLPLILIESIDKIEINDKKSPVVQIIETQMKMIYGLNLGLVALQIKYKNGEESELRLKEIFKGSKAIELMNNKDKSKKI